VEVNVPEEQYQKKEKQRDDRYFSIIFSNNKNIIL